MFYGNLNFCLMLFYVMIISYFGLSWLMAIKAGVIA